ncbi:MAG: primosomal protein N', partial [Candidatus Moranbacteria bacterium]|nr:primosomal protein N' [Candidatus Moranbacteria bacterium]
MNGEITYFCDIAPVVPIPLRNRQAYSYLSESPLSRGSLVLVPFGPRTVQGVVLSCSEIARAERPSGRFKYVKTVIRESFLTDDQISLAESVSKECLTPLGKTLRHFLPAIVKERINTQEPSPEGVKPFRLTGDERDAVRTLAEEADEKPFFLESDMEQALRIIAGAKKKSGKNTQILILLPEIIAVPFTEKFLRDRFGSERVASLHSALGDGAYFTAWERIRSGEADIVIGTRQALFAPFKDIGLIAILEEAETVGYKQWDMSPRYDARQVASSLALLHSATLLLTGSVKGLNTAVSERLGEIRVLQIGDGCTNRDRSITTVDMRKERYKKNRSLFSEELRDAIINVRRDGKSVLLVASRGGLDSFSVCVSCKDVPRCPKCDRALRSTREGGFRCLGCAYRTKSFPRCSKCGSLEFRNVGSGTEKIEREAARIFGNAALVRIDERTFRKSNQKGPYEAAISAGILIGTPSVLNIGKLPDVSVIAIMDADNFLSFPDFQADERFLRVIAKATALVGSSGTVFVQAFQTERETIRHIREKSVFVLLDEIVSDREALRYPPYYRIFRITFRNPDEKAAEAIAIAVQAELSSARGKSETFRISPPMKPIIPKVRGSYERIILVTGPRIAPFPPEFERILLSIPKTWTFDPSP